MRTRRISIIIAAAICAIAAICALTACSQGAQSSSSAASSSSASSAASSSASAQAEQSDYDGAALDALDIASMKGPTSIGLAYLMQNDWGNYTVCAAADEVTPLLLQDEAQIVRVPANVAAMLYSKTDGGIRVLDINTLGVLYVVTGDASVDSVQQLAGRTIYMTGKGTVPEYTVRAVLQAAGVSLDDVTIEFKSEPSEVAAILNSDSQAVGILPQPYATAVTMKSETARQTIDLTEAWKELTGGDKGELVTGVTIAKADFVNDNPDLVAAYLEGAGVSASYAFDHPDSIAQTVVDLGIIDSAQLAEQAIPYCNVVCYTGQDMKSMLSGYLQTLFDQDPASVGGAVPQDDFYYLADSR